MRLSSLDSVRGLAALVVVIGHTSLVFPHGGLKDQPILYWTPLRLLVSGGAAVIVFFVLSGIVLSGSFINRDGFEYKAYAAKRVVRIYTPFFVAILLSIGLKLALDAGEVRGASVWFNQGTWEQPLSRRIILGTMLMDGVHTHLDNPMWSLVHEIRISLVFPLLVLCVKRNWWVCLIGAAIITLTLTKILYHLPKDAFTTSFVQSGIYIVMFVAGVALNTHSKLLRSRISALPRWQHVALWAVALGGLAVGPADAGNITRISEAALLLIATASATLLLALAITEGKAFSFLSSRVPVALGAISFSLYLTHVPVLAAAVHGLPNEWSLGVRVLIGFVASFPVATAFFLCIERPTMVLSKTVGSRLRGTL